MGTVSKLTAEEQLTNADLPTATVASDDKVLIQDTDNSNTLSTVTAQAIADLGGGGVTQTVSTFTPVLSDAQSAGNTATVGTTVGDVIRTGDLVWINIRFINIDTTGMTGGNDLFIQDLPNTSVSTQSCQGQVLTDAVTFAGNYLVCRVLPNTTVGKITRVTSNAADDDLTVAAINGATSDIFLTMTYQTDDP